MVLMLVRLARRQFATPSRSLNIGRVVPEIDPELELKIEDKTINPKRLTTRRNLGLIRLPARLHLAAELKIKHVADKLFRREAMYLQSILYNMKLPDDQVLLEAKRKDLKTEMIVRNKVNELVDYDPSQYHLSEEQVFARDELRQLIEGKLEDKRRDWHYYDYDEYASVLYMATRLAPNYASLKSIMNEIRDLNPESRPESVLDFGSGMGTTMWAVNETWRDTVKEFLNVDLSTEQQNLSEFLLKGGKETADMLPNVYHRQYLPTSTSETYDIVVSAFTLLGLPNSHMRAQTIETLWQKTKDLLVIVERGNHDGFTCVLEARQFVLDLGGHGVTRKLTQHPETKPRINVRLPQAHVLAPCSHEYSCPRLTFSTKQNLNTCRFPISFEPLNLGANKGGYARETFSYVVLRKGPHPNYDSNNHSKPRCPRIIARRLKGTSQITHKLCCPSGDIAEILVTKAKYGKANYDLAKSADWGDTLPIKVSDSYVKNRG